MSGQATGSIAPSHQRLVPTASGIMVGIGFSTRADAHEIASLVALCLDGRSGAALAMPEARAGLAQAREAASLLGLAVVPVADAAIAAVQARCLTRPTRAVFAVAEGAALVASGSDGALLGPRRKSLHATCALAAREATCAPTARPATCAPMAKLA